MNHLPTRARLRQLRTQIPAGNLLPQAKGNRSSIARMNNETEVATEAATVVVIVAPGAGLAAAGGTVDVAVAVAGSNEAEEAAIKAGAICHLPSMLLRAHTHRVHTRPKAANRNCRRTTSR
jgi:hypothetical protein